MYWRDMSRARVESSAPSRYHLRTSDDYTAIPPSRGCPRARGTLPSARGHDPAGPVLLSRLDGQVVAERAPVRTMATADRRAAARFRHVSAQQLSARPAHV